jgi:hypothetical protein
MRFETELDSGFLPTTNLMHAGYCQFMRAPEALISLNCFSFLKFPSPPDGKLKPQALSPNEIKDLLLDFGL